jgi:crotonobetainyl-CoA:carnitine CoA-transferase CaiB-like acyl-CoA transferase
MVSSRSLQGIRVLDLSHTLAGPFATMVLADLGAEVIKVEPPGGDETRTWAPLVDGVSAYYASINRGKKSIIVDLKSPKGREIVYKMAKKSHIVIENYKPGVREKLGVDPDTMFKINPNLVYVSIKGFRPGSIYESLPAYDLIVQAMSGLMMTTGEEGRPPVRVSFALFDIITGLLATTYALATLYRPERPVYVEVPLYDAGVFGMSYVPTIYLMSGKKPKRMGSAHPSIVPYQAFETKDGKWMVVAAANDRFFKKLAEAIGMPELAEDPRFKTNVDRVKNREVLVSMLQEVFKKKTRDEWISILREAGVPVAPVYDIDEVFEDPYSREIVLEIPHPTLGKVRLLSEPGKINGERPNSELHPPLPGEHTIEILKEIGYSDEEIEKLIKDNVVFAYGRNI